MAMRHKAATLALNVLTAFAGLSLALFANISCLRAASFGDRFAPPPPGFYEQMFWSGLAMLASSLTGLFALFAPRLRHLTRAVLLVGTPVMLVAAPLAVPGTDSFAQALDLALWTIAILAPVLGVSLIYLVAGSRASGAERPSS